MVLATIFGDAGSLGLAAVAFAVLFYLLYALAHPERF
jgi:hypothetical protein